MAVAEGHVTIDAAAERFGRIVEVHAAEVAKTHRAVDQGEGALACLGGAQVVAGGEGVAGVDAEPYSRLILDAVDDIGQLLECEAEVGALSRSVFDNGRNAACRVERYVDRLGDAVERLYLRNFLQVAARVEVEAVESQRLAALHLVEERCPRLFEGFALGVAEVDQVAVVRQYLPGGVPLLGACLAECLDLCRGKGGSVPLPLVFGK